MTGTPGTRRAWSALWLGVLLAVSPARALAEDGGSPHEMTSPDGSLDMDKCAVCHTADMGLILPKMETCLLCHVETTHGGSLAHLRAAPDRVKDGMTRAPAGAPALPLREDGGIFCGTCHLFHDPNVLGETELAHGWLPPDSGLAGAVRADVIARWNRFEEGADEKRPLARFATAPMRRLRLPVEDGSLCLVCHGGLR